ncbi:MAG TPA: hypothetical protein PLO37_18270 [Candidatus Hydrogenedentes bacterium]|nr:hypothetical protein [Candidatus Hydrogenedentota bacterium]HPG68797.1 hypothetical protein [Candidatus Hydrogenedentota bacterium]
MKNVMRVLKWIMPAAMILVAVSIVNAGSLTPTTAPAPTMHTLNEIHDAVTNSAAPGGAEAAPRNYYGSGMVTNCRIKVEIEGMSPLFEDVEVQGGGASYEWSETVVPGGTTYPPHVNKTRTNLNANDLVLRIAYDAELASDSRLYTWFKQTPVEPKSVSVIYCDSQGIEFFRVNYFDCWAKSWRIVSGPSGSGQAVVEEVIISANQIDNGF